MANRVIRDWTTSETMDSISLEAEVFFTRLIMKADDFGSYHANIKLLKAGLFPLKEVSRDQVTKWMKECVQANLIFMYEVEGKGYIRIKDFGQRLRNMRNAFPHPVDNSQQVAAKRGDSPPETKRNEVETETETGNEGACVIGDKKVSCETGPLTDEWFSSALDELHLEQKALTYRDHDIKDQFEKFKSKVRGSPNDYIHRDTDGLRKAFDYQLRTTKPQKKYESAKRTLTETSPAAGKDYSERF